ncbi:MAG: 3-hydroxylacyl-ACP dehydratase [Gammaproteobacteria bacterium]|nr:3-hydroxylacyl-ACP dehydratase [Gammaproteobacteria bacterium]
MTNNEQLNQRFDPQILELIPHRPPMLLINALESVSADASSADVLIDRHAPFFQPGLGVPSWVGLEYMGQTAALIAGYQLREGLVKPNLGFLLGCRFYHAYQEYFDPSTRLSVSCNQAALVGESLATFNCTISKGSSDQILAEASLSVFRKPQAEPLQ